jgi:ABC-type antimicrobial peptide transport system permease subunit
MMLPLILGWLRDSPRQSYTAGAAISLEAAMLLTLAGIQHGLKSDPTFARLNFTLWTSLLLLLVVAVGSLFVAIERYFSVIERTQEFGVLHVLGAAAGHYSLLLVMEASIICIPGTVAGICLTFLIRWGMRVTFPEFLKLDIAYFWWPIVLLIVEAASLIGSAVAVRKAVRDGLIQALSYEK